MPIKLIRSPEREKAPSGIEKGTSEGEKARSEIQKDISEGENSTSEVLKARSRTKKLLPGYKKVPRNEKKVVLR